MKFAGRAATWGSVKGEGEVIKGEERTCVVRRGEEHEGRPIGELGENGGAGDVALQLGCDVHECGEAVLREDFVKAREEGRVLCPNEGQNRKGEYRERETAYDDFREHFVEGELEMIAARGSLRELRRRPPLVRDI